VRGSKRTVYPNRWGRHPLRPSPDQSLHRQCPTERIGRNCDGSTSKHGARSFFLIAWGGFVYLFGWKQKLNMNKPLAFLEAIVLCYVVGMLFGIAITHISAGLRWENPAVREWLTANISLAYGVGFMFTLLIMLFRCLPRRAARNQQEDQRPTW